MDNKKNFSYVTTELPGDMATQSNHYHVLSLSGISFALTFYLDSSFIIFLLHIFYCVCFFVWLFVCLFDEKIMNEHLLLFPLETQFVKFSYLLEHFQHMRVYAASRTSLFITLNVSPYLLLFSCRNTLLSQTHHYFILIVVFLRAYCVALIVHFTSGRKTYCSFHFWPKDYVIFSYLPGFSWQVTSTEYRLYHGSILLT